MAAIFMSGTLWLKLKICPAPCGLNKKPCPALCGSTKFLSGSLWFFAQFGSSRERIAATNAANVQYACQQSVERALGDQQEPTAEPIVSNLQTPTADYKCAVGVWRFKTSKSLLLTVFSILSPKITFVTEPLRVSVIEVY